MRRGHTFVPPLRRQRRDLSRSLAAGIDQALRPRPSERGTLEDLRLTLLESLDRADDTRGVIAPGWRGRLTRDDTWVQGDPVASGATRRPTRPRVCAWRERPAGGQSPAGGAPAAR